MLPVHRPEHDVNFPLDQPLQSGGGLCALKTRLPVVLNEMT